MASVGAPYVDSRAPEGQLCRQPLASSELPGMERGGSERQSHDLPLLSMKSRTDAIWSALLRSDYAVG